jgi:predicted esterase
VNHAAEAISENPSLMNLIKSVLVLAAITLAPNPSAIAQETSAYDQVTNLVYAEVHGTGLLLDIFTPTGKANGLGIVDVVSGSYYSDRRKIRDHTLAGLYRIFCSHGYTVFAVRPGSKTRYTGAEMEAHVKLGIRYVKQHAAEYKVDPNRLGLTGASAGGHLAVLAAITPEDGKSDARDALLRLDTRVAAAGIFFPPTDLLDWNGKPANLEIVGDLLFLGGAKGHPEAEIRERARLLSPAQLVKGPTIPFLLIHGDADPIVPLQQSQKLVAALKAAGSSAELIVKPGGGHPCLTLPEEVEVMAKWFDQQLIENTTNASPTLK